MFLARKFNELKLLVSVVFCHPPGPQWVGRLDRAQPLKLFFTDQTRVTTSTGGENSVIQMIGSLYDNIEATYGTLTTRLYRAFRPRPVKSSTPLRLRKLCCIPYAALYMFSFVLVLAEIVLIIMSAEGLPKDDGGGRSPPTAATQQGLANVTSPIVEDELVRDQEEQWHDLERLVLGCLIALGIILGVIIIANIYTIGQTILALVFSQRTHLQRTVAKHDLVQSEGYLQVVRSKYQRP